MATIRPAVASDTEALRAIFNPIIARGDAFVYEVPLTSADLARYIDSYTGVFVIESNGRVLGGYTIRPNLPGRGAHVCNATFIVDEIVRGQGVGRQLGQDAIDRARDLGFLAIQFNAVVETNLAAVSLWQSLGFKIAGVIPGGFRHISGQFVDLLIMHRTL